MFIGEEGNLLKTDEEIQEVISNCFTMLFESREIGDGLLDREQVFWVSEEQNVEIRLPITTEEIKIPIFTITLKSPQALIG